MIRPARTSMDASRMASAVARPGIDPRVWLTLATVKEIGIDPTEGLFADVACQPDGVVETCYIDAPYAGSEDGVGFGENCPVEVGDTVLVGIPGGDSGNGPIIIARWHNSGDPPPSQIIDGDVPTKDRWIVIRKNQQFHVLATLLGLFEGGGTQLDVKPDGFGVKSQLAGGAVSGELTVEPAAIKAAVGPLTAVQIDPSGVRVDAASVSLGLQALAFPLAHALEVQAALTALQTFFDACSGAVDAAVAVPGGGAIPVTNLMLQGYISAGMKAVSAAIVAGAATLATKNTRAS